MAGADPLPRSPPTGRAGIPATASAATLNVTVVNPTGGGWVTVFSCGQPQPNASNLNDTTGDIIPNTVITSIDTAGRVCIYTSAATHLLVDASGSLRERCDRHHAGDLASAISRRVALSEGGEEDGELFVREHTIGGDVGQSERGTLEAGGSRTNGSESASSAERHGVPPQRRLLRRSLTEGCSTRAHVGSASPRQPPPAKPVGNRPHTKRGDRWLGLG
jgi:hypothetical protein